MKRIAPGFKPLYDQSYQLPETRPPLRMQSHNDLRGVGGGASKRQRPGTPVQDEIDESVPQVQQDQLPPILRGCWNCGGKHDFRDCKKPEKKCCHLCGLEGYTKYNCPRLSCIETLSRDKERFARGRVRSRPSIPLEEAFHVDVEEPSRFYKNLKPFPRAMPTPYSEPQNYGEPSSSSHPWQDNEDSANYEGPNNSSYPWQDQSATESAAVASSSPWNPTDGPTEPRPASIDPCFSEIHEAIGKVMERHASRLQPGEWYSIEIPSFVVHLYKDENHITYSYES